MGDLAAEDLVTLPEVGDLTTEDLVTEDSDAGSAAASDIMDITATIRIPMTATLIPTITTRAIIRDRVRFRRPWLHLVDGRKLMTTIFFCREANENWNSGV